MCIRFQQTTLPEILCEYLKMVTKISPTLGLERKSLFPVTVRKNRVDKSVRRLGVGRAEKTLG